MKHRLIQVTPYLIALLLTWAILAPGITVAQDDDEPWDSSEDEQSEPSVAPESPGWIQDGPNLYYSGGAVGIGNKPNTRSDAQLQVQNRSGNAGMLFRAIRDGISNILMLEKDLSHGFNIAYDGGVPNPETGGDSGLFGIWRLDGSSPPLPVLTAYRHSGNIGIATLPSVDPAIQLQVAGNQLIEGTDGFNEYGEVARLYLGDAANYIGAKHGTGVQIGAWHAPEALTVQQVTGNVGIGTTSPRAKLEISGPSGIEGLHLSLSGTPNAPPDHSNSPMIKWDATTYPGVNSIWYARAEGNNWVLSSSSPSYENVNTAIRISPDGEICLGSGCSRRESTPWLDVSQRS